MNPLVAMAHKRALKKHGDARHLLSKDAWEALVKAEAFDIIAAQVAEAPGMVAFANEVLRSLEDGS